MVVADVVAGVSSIRFCSILCCLSPEFLVFEVFLVIGASNRLFVDGVRHDVVCV